jgi:hypothetical protein
MPVYPGAIQGDRSPAFGRMMKAAKFAGFHPARAGPIANWKVIALVSGNIETVSGPDAPVGSPLRGL